MDLSNPSSEFGSELPQIIEETMPVRYYKLGLTYSKLVNINGAPLRRIIYDSEWCRVQFEYYFRQPPETHELHIWYGRLHAPSDEHIMVWNGERCRSWHGSGLLYLYFLDGASPSYAQTQKRGGGKAPIALEEFKSSEIAKKYRSGYGIKYPLIRHTAVWNHYELKLFELFDLRRPDLWEKYTNFLKEYYALEDEYSRSKGEIPFSSDPPRYKVC